MSVSSGWFRGIILITGYPGSGKGTQGVKLAARLGVPHVSTGELFRAEVASDSANGRLFEYYMLQGQVIPGSLIFDYLSNEFAKPKYVHGFVLDGFPKNQECLEWMMNEFKPPVPITRVVFLDVPRQVAENRLLQRGHSDTGKSNERSDDVPDAIKERLDAFDEQTRPLLVMYNMFGLLNTIDGTLDIERVAEDIEQVLWKPWKIPCAYNLSCSSKESRFHSHLDARNHYLVSNMARQLVSDQTQIKIYPVSHLLLGPQTRDLPFSGIYQQLPNFHSIHNAKDEAFMTCKMGSEGYDYGTIRKTLNLAFKTSGKGIMTEIEQEVYESETLPDGKTVEHFYDYKPVDWEQVGLEWKEKRIVDIPKYELHHGIDVPNPCDDVWMPMTLSTLMQLSIKAGLSVGGWFVFPKQDVWSYRCNEFVNEGSDEGLIAQLKAQSNQLRKLVTPYVSKSVTMTCSLERVDGIWCNK